MNEQITGQIRDLLTQYDSAGIVVGKNSSVDAMGAALALYLSLQNTGKNVTISSATTPLVEHSSLIGIDKIKGSFEGDGGDLIVSFPYKEGEIDKVSYTLEEGFLNIIVKPGELGLNFIEDDVIYRRKGAYPQVIFTIGVQKLSDLSSVFDISSLKDSKVVNIDNHIENQSFGDILIIDSNASSVSEIVGNLISNVGLDMDMDVAQNLLDGISSATGNFQNPNTTPSAFGMVAALMQRGAKRHSQSQVKMEVPRQDQGDVLEMLNQMQNQQRPQNSGQNQQGRASRGRSFPQGGFNQRNEGQQGNQASASQSQNQTQNIMIDDRNENLKNPPDDWLTPKVYKGSTNV